MEALAKAQTEAPQALSQKETVYQLAIEALGGSANVADGQPLKALVTKEVRKAIRAKLFEGIRSGAIGFKPNKTDGELKKYCSSLINNWLKKDKRFN